MSAPSQRAAATRMKCPLENISTFPAVARNRLLLPPGELPVSQTGDEDDGYPDADLAKHSLQFQARHAVEIQVYHETVPLLERLWTQETLSRVIRADLEPGDTEPRFEGRRDTPIIVNDRYIDFVELG